MRIRTTPGQNPDQVVASCVRLARRSLKSPMDRIVILEALRPYMRGMTHDDLNGEGYAQALYEWAHSFAYVREPAGPDYCGEVVQAPLTTIRLRAGDCDCLATLIATAAGFVGMPAAIGYVMTGDNFAHILAAVRPGYYSHGDWIVIDPQSKEKGPTPADDYPGATWTQIQKAE